MKHIRFSIDIAALRSGFGLIETIVAVGIFSIIAVTGMTTILHTYSINRLSANETEASLMAQEGIDAVRSVRNQGWNSPFLSGALTHSCSTGCGVTTGGGYWALKSGSDTQGAYTRTILIENVFRDGTGAIVTSGGTLDPDTRKVTSQVAWDFTASRNNAVEVTTYLTRFDKAIPCGAVLSSAVSTNLNQASAFALSWDSSSLNTTFFSYSSSAPTKLVVQQAGDYLMALTLPVARSDASANVTRIQSEFRVNGIKHDVGVGRSAFIENADSQTESSNNFHVLIENLSAGDEIEVFLIGRASTTPTVTISGAATLYAEYIPSTETIFTGTATRTVGSTNLNTTASPLQWTEKRKDTGFTHSNSTNSHNITIDSTGNYLVLINIPLSGAVTRGNIIGRVLRNGSQVTGGAFKQGYIQNTNGDTTSSIHFSGIVTTTAANQILTVTVEREAAAGTITVGGEKATIFIQKLSSTGVYFGNGTTLTNGTNWNPASQGSVLWTTDTLLDTSYFTHSTSSNQDQITINQMGNYLLVYNDALSAAAGRPNPQVNVTINSTGLVGAETQSHYIRGLSSNNESSGALVFPLASISQNDVVRMSVSREADIDTVSTTADALLAIIQKISCPTPDGAPTATPTATPTPTDTPTPTNTPTDTPTPTNTPTSTPTDTPTPTNTPTDTPTPTNTPTPTPNPCPTQASCLLVDVSGANIGGTGNRLLQGITIRRTDPTVITVQTMTVSWTLAGRTMNRIRINGSIVWSGTANSGTLVNITDYAPATTFQNINDLRFNNTMVGSSFTLQFHMADASTYSIDVINPP